ncbi:MAG: hypothetical protein IPM96_21880 [Ignavibacteria bacterium]|nr:hypothetical protein [Ignavibacteria bacterium]
MNTVKILNRKMNMNYSEKIKELDKLFESSALYKDSESYLKLLKFISRTKRLSPFNAFMVHYQNPSARVVLTKAQWMKRNRIVKPEVRPMVILIPFGPIAFVYDILDTNKNGITLFDDLPIELVEPFNTSGIFDESILNLTINNCKKENLEIEINDLNRECAGYVMSLNKGFSITINRSLKTNDRYSTLIHELGHIFSGHIGVNEYSWWNDRPDLSSEIKEIEAESISYLVCKRAELDTKSEQYLSTYIKNNKVMPNIKLDTILTVSGYIEKMGTKKFIKKYPKKVSKTLKLKKE